MTTESDSALIRLGLTDRERALFGELSEHGFELVRVTRVDRGLPLVSGARGTERAEPAAHLIKSADSAMSRAVVGDWVAVARPEGHDMPIMEAILPRHSAFTRKDPGDQADEQVLVANVDLVLIAQSLSGDGINVRRLERELVVAWDSGAVPVVVLTKSDLCDDVDEQLLLAEEVAHGTEVVVESAVTGQGLDQVERLVSAGVTATLLGGSGVGKSTLVNRLVGEDVLATSEVRAGDDKGRHTTVAREMIEVPSGGVIIDTPGMRSLGLWDAETGMGAAFPDIEALAERCRFRDCTHAGEPGCAVAAAVEDGELPARRLESYLRLTKELEMLGQRRTEKEWRSKASFKSQTKAARRFYKTEPKRKGE